MDVDIIVDPAMVLLLPMVDGRLSLPLSLPVLSLSLLFLKLDMVAVKMLLDTTGLGGQAVS